MGVVLATTPAPLCSAAAVQVRAGAATDIPLFGCPDDGRTITLRVTRQPKYGFVTVERRDARDVLHYASDGSVAPPYYLLDRFGYTVSDGSTDDPPEVEETVVLGPPSDNYAPRCGLVDPDARHLRTVEIESDETVRLGASCSDFENDPLASSFDPVTFGRVQATGSEAYVYTPPLDDPGPDGTFVRLSFTATDAPPAPAQPATSAPAVLFVHVVRADHDPVCADQVAFVLENSRPTPVPVPCSDADPDDTLRIGIPDQQPDVQVTPDEGAAATVFVYPRRDFFGTETVAFNASDDDETSPPATLTVIVWPRDRAAAERRRVKALMRDVIAPVVLRAVRRGRRVGPFPHGVLIQARVAGASTTLASGTRRLAPGRAARVPLRLSRAGRILRSKGRLHGQLTVTVGAGGVSGRASSSYR